MSYIDMVRYLNPTTVQAALVIRGGYVPRISRKYQNRE